MGGVPGKGIRTELNGFGLALAPCDFSLKARPLQEVRGVLGAAYAGPGEEGDRAVWLAMSELGYVANAEINQYLYV